MRDPQLVDLNFRNLLHYDGQPPVQYTYPTPIPCAGYCTSCEDDGTLARAGGQLDLMSHGCDSQDFTSVLGPLPIEGRAVDAPILFLLEEPGGDWESGQKIRFRACLKQPPNYHYYWSPGGHIWPTSLADLGDNFYGTYFAYLMRKHGLRNVYITNVVKCRWVAAADDARRDKSPIVEHCTQRFLAREVTILKPRLVLCFGNDALAESQEVRRHCAPQCRVGTLLHPSYIQYRCQTHGRTKQDCLDINDSRVCEALTDIT